MCIISRLRCLKGRKSRRLTTAWDPTLWPPQRLVFAPFWQEVISLSDTTFPEYSGFHCREYRTYVRFQRCDSSGFMEQGLVRFQSGAFAKNTFMPSLVALRLHVTQATPRFLHFQSDPVAGKLIVIALPLHRSNNDYLYLYCCKLAKFLHINSLNLYNKSIK